MMEEIVQMAMAQYGMVQKGDNVIVALSGGADSVALLHFMAAIAPQHGFALEAAHLNHGLRGKEADRDEAFVVELCKNRGIKLHRHRVNMADMQKPRGLGTEAWARKLRYAFFEVLVRQTGGKIALAHTLSDNAETVLFRLARGTGPRGLAGIPPVRGAYIRPFINISRAQIEVYCKKHGLHFVQDSTNQNLAYARNRIRLQVLPALELAHPGALASVGRLAADMRALDMYLAQQAARLLHAAKEKDGYRADVLNRAPLPVLLQAISTLAGGHNLTRRAIAAVQRVLQTQSRAAQLPGGKRAWIQDGLLYIQKAHSLQPAAPYAFLLEEGKYTLPGGYNLTVKMVNYSEDIAKIAAYQKNCKKSLTFVADYDKITKNILLRNRKTGDLFAPRGRNLTKTLKKWMNEQKIPIARRDTLPLLCQGNCVLWVWGHGFCEGVQVGTCTQKVLLLETACN